MRTCNEVVRELVADARREAEEAALVSTGSQFTAIRARYEQGRQVRADLEAWAAPSTPAEVDAAVRRFEVTRLS